MRTCRGGEQQRQSGGSQTPSSMRFAELLAPLPVTLLHVPASAHLASRHFLGVEGEGQVLQRGAVSKQCCSNRAGCSLPCLQLRDPHMLPPGGQHWLAPLGCNSSLHSEVGGREGEVRWMG